MKRTSGWWVVMGLFSLLLTACGGAKTADEPDADSIESAMAKGARVMWVAAHPDDECFSGGILARASIHYGNPLYMLIYTHGDGGECCIPGGCYPDTATVRAAEMEKVAHVYRAKLQLESFFNAPLPMSSFPSRDELYRLWSAKADPVRMTAKAIREFKPDIVLTFEPTFGGTGHPEHQLASRITTTAIRLAADTSTDIDGLAAHRVERTYYVLNRYWLLKLAGAADPGPVTEIFDASQPCAEGLSCNEFMAYATEYHKTQANDMGTVRRLRHAFEKQALRRVDPWSSDVPGL